MISSRSSLIALGAPRRYGSGGRGILDSFSVDPICVSASLMIGSGFVAGSAGVTPHVFEGGYSFVSRRVTETPG